MNDLTKFLTLLATLSVAVERAVEIFKGFVPILNTPLPPGPAENKRRAALQFLTVLISTGTAAVAHTQIAAIPAANALLGANMFYSGYLIIGLLTAGGSTFWNHLLDIIGALKTQQENTAKAGATAAPAPIAPAAATTAAAAGK